MQRHCTHLMIAFGLACACGDDPSGGEGSDSYYCPGGMGLQDLNPEG